MTDTQHCNWCEQPATGTADARTQNWPYVTRVGCCGWHAQYVENYKPHKED